MINDFWWLTFDFAPHDSAIEAKCQKKYVHVFHFHWTFYLIVGILCFPLAIFIGLIDFIRINKAAYYNAQLYRAEYYGEEFKPPSDSRTGLWIIASVIVAFMFAVYYIYHPTGI